MSSVKVLLLLALLAAALLLTSCGGNESGPSRGSQSLTNPGDVPTATPWATPPPVVYVEGGPMPVAGGEGSYTVQAGDIAYDIALKFGITVEELAAANNMSVEQIAELSVGQKLIIPRPPSQQQPVTTATAQASGPTATRTPSASGGTYTVQEGDYPSSIAEKLGISAEALMQANGITDPASLKIGQELIIPTPTPSP
jgi:LysM repeat protein